MNDKLNMKTIKKILTEPQNDVTLATHVDWLIHDINNILKKVEESEHTEKGAATMHLNNALWAMKAAKNALDRGE